MKHPLSRYVEKTFEKYLDCGNPGKGFALAYCQCCHTDFMIAFSCKCRGICPSCSTLTMVKTAAHLVEHVIPAIPVRQWVISFPLRVRHYLLEPGILQNILNFFEKRGWFDNQEVEKMLAYENSGFSLDASVKIESWEKDDLERLIRYCARPRFVSENLRMNGPWVHYRLSKPTYKGQRFVQLDPLEFMDRIAAFIPSPRRHRWHYHGIFAPNSPHRKNVVAYADKAITVTFIHLMAEKTKRVSLDWANLIKRIYEVDPLLCSKCGEKIKIIGFVTHQAEIHRILRRMGLCIELHEFDPANHLHNWEFSQLIPDTVDGFPLMEEQQGYWNGPDPPFPESHSDPPHGENDYDSSYQEQEIDPPHWED